MKKFNFKTLQVVLATIVMLMGILLMVGSLVFHTNSIAFAVGFIGTVGMSVLMSID